MFHDLRQLRKNRQTADRPAAPVRVPLAAMAGFSGLAGMGDLGATAADWRRLCNRTKLPHNDPNYTAAPNACAKADEMEAAERAITAASTGTTQAAAQDAAARARAAALAVSPLPPNATPAQQAAAAQLARDATVAQAAADRIAAQAALVDAQNRANAATAAAAQAAADRDAEAQRRQAAATQAVLNKSRYIDTLDDENALRAQLNAPPVAVAPEHTAALDAPAVDISAFVARSSPIRTTTGGTTGTDALVSAGTNPYTTAFANSLADVTPTSAPAAAASGPSSTVLVIGGAAIFAMLFLAKGKPKKGGRLMYADRIMGMGDWTDALPAWAVTILRTVEGQVPGLATFDTATQVAIAAISDLPAQADRILAAREHLNNVWATANEATKDTGGIPFDMYDGFIAQSVALDQAQAANDAASDAVGEAIDALTAAGTVLPGLEGFGMGLLPLLVGAVVIIVLALGAEWAWQRVQEHAASEKGLTDRASIQAQMDQNSKDRDAGRTPTYPAPAAAPVPTSIAKTAVSGVLAIGGFAVGGWLLLEFFKARKGASA